MQHLLVFSSWQNLAQNNRPWIYSCFIPVRYVSSKLARLASILQAARSTLMPYKSYQGMLNGNITPCQKAIIHAWAIKATHVRVSSLSSLVPRAFSIKMNTASEWNWCLHFTTELVNCHMDPRVLSNVSQVLLVSKAMTAKVAPAVFPGFWLL